MTDKDPSQIGVVVVLHDPPEGWESRLRAMGTQGAASLIVDNASSAATRARLEEFCREPGWELIANSQNVGLATALNIGVRHFAARGFQWVLLFDQDSEPAANMSEQLLASWRQSASPDRVAVIGASFQDVGTGLKHRFLARHPLCPWFFQKVVLDGKDQRVTMVVTSGSLVRVSAFAAIGSFADEFFIDYIDTDFCLRCSESGCSVIASAAAQMTHRLGSKESRRWLGFQVHPTHHSPLRHYYIARNRIPMLRRHGFRNPHWLLFECATTLLWGFRVLTVEAQKGRKFLAMLLGTWDGLRGLAGECPEGRRRRLQT